MVDRIPSGTRDFLPDEMRELRAMTDRVRAVFERAGYGEVYTPALEYESALGGAWTGLTAQWPRPDPGNLIGRLAPATATAIATSRRATSAVAAACLGFISSRTPAPRKDFPDAG